MSNLPRSTRLLRLTALALYGLALRPVPDAWPFAYRRLDRADLFPTVTALAATASLGGKAVSRQEVNNAVRAVAATGPVKVRSTNHGSGTDLLITLDDREPGEWGDYLAGAFHVTEADFLAYAVGYDVDVETPVDLAELSMTSREASAVERAQRSEEPRACARCHVVKDADAFRVRAGTTRRHAYCRECQTAYDAERRPAVEARPTRAPRLPLASPAPLTEDAGCPENHPSNSTETPTPPRGPVTPPPPPRPVQEFTEPACPPDPALWTRHVVYVMARAEGHCEAAPRTYGPHRAVDVERVDAEGPWDSSNAHAVCDLHRKA